MPPPGGKNPCVTYSADGTVPDLTSPQDLPPRVQAPSTQRGKDIPWDNRDVGMQKEMGEAMARALPQI